MLQHTPWDAKRWVQGLIFDESPEVRGRVAHWIGWAVYRTYLPDLQIAYSKETVAKVKQVVMAQTIELLEVK